MGGHADREAAGIRQLVQAGVLLQARAACQKAISAWCRAVTWLPCRLSSQQLGQQSRWVDSVMQRITKQHFRLLQLAVLAFWRQRTVAKHGATVTTSFMLYQIFSMWRQACWQRKEYCQQCILCRRKKK